MLGVCVHSLRYSHYLLPRVLVCMCALFALFSLFTSSSACVYVCIIIRISFISQVCVNKQGISLRLTFALKLLTYCLYKKNRTLRNIHLLLSVQYDNTIQFTKTKILFIIIIIIIIIIICTILTIYFLRGTWESGGKPVWLPTGFRAVVDR